MAASSSCAVVLGCTLLVGCTGVDPGRRERAIADPAVAATYAWQCAPCHGGDGRGDGAMAAYLWPPPRPFADGRFSLVSTDNALPSDVDLMQVIARGMPGSAMPAFDWLSADELRQLARYVRDLAVATRSEVVLAEAASLQRPMSSAQATELAATELAPGRPLPSVPAVSERDPDVLATGREVFTHACAACHGPDGRGRPMAREWCDRFDLHWARDFTSGVLRGGADAVAVAHRVQAGMPASGMPPAHLPDAELAAVVAFVRSLMPEDARRPAPIGRRQVDVPWVEGTLPADADDPRWRPVRIGLSPLQWHEGAVAEVDVAAVHDGTDIAVRVSWPDPSEDASPLQSLLPDAVALQLSDSPDPPMLAMGRAGESVRIWHWQAFEPRDNVGLTDLLGDPPSPAGRVDAGLPAQPRRAVARAVRARGPTSAASFADRGQPFSTWQQWRDGRWYVLFRRPLRPRDPEQIVLQPGDLVHVALAVWNGGAGDYGPRKAISSWQRLVLAR